MEIGFISGGSGIAGMSNLNKDYLNYIIQNLVELDSLADIIIVATDDQRIYDCVKGFGGNVEMTSVEHKCGSDRIMEVVSRHPEISFICNLQGDEPLIKPESIDKNSIIADNSFTFLFS